MMKRSEVEEKLAAGWIVLKIPSDIEYFRKILPPVRKLSKEYYLAEKNDKILRIYKSFDFSTNDYDSMIGMEFRIIGNKYAEITTIQLIGEEGIKRYLDKVYGKRIPSRPIRS